MRELLMDDEIFDDENLITSFDDYEEQAMETAIYPGALIYPSLGLAGEAGEVADKVKKLVRDEFLPLDCESAVQELEYEEREAIVSELSDCLWYITATANDLGFSLSEVATFNLEKLQSRQKRGKLQGSGDNR